MINLTHAFSDSPELLALALVFFGIYVSRWSAERAPVTRLITRVPIFLIFTYFLFLARQVPYLTVAQSPDALARILGDGLRAIWWFWAASIGSNVIRNFAFRGAQPTGHRFFTDLSVAGVYVFAFVGFITFVLNFPIQGILVTSGAVAVILGLALQSSLGDVFYGVVLNLGKPYREGDWISLDNGVDGRVLEMNWRATHMLTISQDVVIVPNSVVAKSKIINSSFPSSIHGTTMAVLLAPDTFPTTARRLLNEAIQGCSLVLSTPAPVIVIKSLSQEGILLEITFFTSRIDESSDAQNQLYEKIFRTMGAAGIRLGARTTAFESPINGNPALITGEVERLVAFTPIFSRLPSVERNTIAGLMMRVTLEIGETVVQTGDVSEAMYVIGSGVLSYVRTIEGRDIEIARMSTADHFGAASLMSGRRSEGNVSALTLAVVYRIEKKDLLQLAETRPGFAAGLQRELAARQILAGNIIDSHSDEESADESLANWISNLFHRPDESVGQKH